MVSSYDVSASAVLPVTPEVAYDAVLSVPLEEILHQRSGLIPGIARCEDQVGEWGTVGQTRTVVMIRHPAAFAGSLMKPLISSIDGRFTFVPEGPGTRVTWSWKLHPTALGRPGMPLLGIFWRRWAAGMFVRLGDRVGV